MFGLTHGILEQTKEQGISYYGNPEALWEFENTKLDTINNYLLASDLSTYSTGKVGSYGINGDGAHKMTNNDIQLTPPWTISFWHYYDAANYFSLFTSSDSSLNNFIWIWRNTPGGSVYFCVYVADGQYVTQYANYPYLTDDSSGWYHYAIACQDDDNFYLQINALGWERYDVSTDRPGWVSESDGFTLGGMPSIKASAYKPPFTGKIDQCYVYDRVLSQEDVSALYNGGTGI